MITIMKIMIKNNFNKDNRCSCHHGCKFIGSSKGHQCPPPRYMILSKLEDNENAAANRWSASPRGFHCFHQRLNCYRPNIHIGLSRVIHHKILWRIFGQRNYWYFCIHNCIYIYRYIYVCIYIYNLSHTGIINRPTLLTIRVYISSHTRFSKHEATDKLTYQLSKCMKSTILHI